MARNYPVSEMFGAMLDNAPRDAAKVAFGLTDRAVHPLESLEDLRRFDRGLLQFVVPGEQEYETDYTRPVVRQWAMDWGIYTDEDGRILGFDKEQFKRRLAEQPIDSAMDVLLVKAIVTGHLTPLELAHIAERVHRGKATRPR